jgi:hypothetical protein
MKVSDLAEELDVPTSLILDQCQRFGIDASWAGAELAGADLVVLRAELAAADPIDLTPADPGPAEVPASSAEGGASDAPLPGDRGEPAAPEHAEAPLPPTAVGSMPELIDEVTPSVPAGEGAGAGAGAGGAGPGGVGAVPGPTMGGAATKAPPRPPAGKPRLDRGARTCVIAIVVAAAAFAGANFTELPAVVAVLWLIAAVALVVAVVDGWRGRRRIQTHPERVHGLWVATIGVVVAIGGLIGLTASVMGAAAEEPAAEAPLGVGDLKSVQVARWGYQRVGLIKENGWKQPAREEGTCWEDDSSEQRDEDRVEVPDNDGRTRCNQTHTLEVAKVFAYNRDADAAYPTDEEFLAAVGVECGDLAERAAGKDPDAQLKAEYPTEVAWRDGDHDVACVLLTPERDQPLVTS